MSILVGFAEPTARAADAKPAKKDSSSRSRPKEAKFTTTISPAKAKPGQTVTYKVTAKIDAPWHIYAYSKTPVENGPRYTEFDFFDPAGLTLEKDWTASVEPTRKKEPAFPDIPFLEYHEEEVVWSRKLKVPDDAKPGVVTLRCQIGYMICSDQNCSFPGQWTLPPADLTINGAGSPSSLRSKTKPKVRLVSAVVDDPAPSATKPEPKAKETRRPIPKEVTVTSEIAPGEARAGETVQLKLTAKLAPGWHIFQYAKEFGGSGPQPLLVDNFDLGGLTPKGDWTSTTAPERKKDPNFPEIEAVELFEGEVTWTLPLEVPPGTATGPKPVRVQASFQTCSDTRCNPAGHWTIAATNFRVIPGGSSALAADSKPATPGAETNPKASDSVKSTSLSSEPRTADLPTTSKIEQISRSGIIPFLLACAAAGLYALALPCIWPMIPVTVNFFVKQGEKNGGKATGLAIMYCLAIIGIFTGIGVAFSALLGASSLSNLANNPWLNTAVATLFFAFGLSLLGLFEISLPSSLLNASAQGEGRGGMVGVMFMATTLTITSFTCTFPVVGGLLVLAAKGSYLYPIIGLVTFASVIALPFFVLALAPGLLARMPKSGDWMNSVKVVGGLVEVAAAFKFVNTAEIGFHSVPEAAWVDEQTLLTIWVIMALVCGIYLLGLFRTDHDQKDVQVGPGRMVMGSAFLFLALYLAPALFGHPPEGQIYSQIVVGLLPPRGSEVKATSTDPEIAITQEKSKHGVVWGMSFEAALAEARKDNKRILIDFTGVNCSVCRQMERTVMPRPDVAEKMKQFVTVQLYTDYVPISSLTQAQRAELAEKNIDRELKLTNEASSPIYVIIDPSINPDQPVATHPGYADPVQFLDFLNKGSAATKTEKTASNNSPKVADRK